MVRLLFISVAVVFVVFPTPSFAASKTFVWDPSSSVAFPRVRWCADRNSLCGKVAADYYCQREGFDHASDFAKDISPESLDGNPHLVGIPGTQSARLVRRTCNADYCKTFASITCVAGAQSIKSHGKHAVKKLRPKK